MLQTITISPGAALHCFQDHRFKQGCLSIQFVGPMTGEAASANALLPAVLLRGCRSCPDLRAITARLDDLYGAAVSPLVRRVGDYHTTGFYCNFIEDRFAMDGDAVLAPMAELIRELLLEPLTVDDGFDPAFVESEKRNLISAIDAERNDKRAYAAAQLLREMCREDSFGIPRLGDRAGAEAQDEKSLYRHYLSLLRHSRIELFYAGSREPEQVAALLRPIFDGPERDCRPLPPQTGFHDAGGSHRTQRMEVAQGQLCLGFATPITNRDPAFAAMQVVNTVFGAGMTSKLFMNVREKLSLCYSIGSGYYGTKGIMTVSAGIDPEQEPMVRQEILTQLDACRKGDITPAELEAAKEAILSGLRGVHDSPGAIEGYYATAALSGLTLSLQEYAGAVAAVDTARAAEAAGTLALHSSYFLRGVTE